jgi:NhaP-type Na+/H+ or K+/H+ antiporter
MLAGWFGIRGIGTVYYLAHALDMGVAEHDPAESRLLLDVCIAVISVSVVVHGISATPLMRWYGGGGRKGGRPRITWDP